MGQKKIKLEFIEDDKKRKTTFKVREKGIIKKVKELSILCDIHACAIIYSPYTAEPIVWPSPLGVQQVISEFNNMPEVEKNNRSLNHASFLKKMIWKVDGQMKRQQSQNHDNELTQMMIDGMLIGEEMLQNFSSSDLDDLGNKVDKILEKVNERIESFTSQHDDALLTPPANSSISVTSQQVESLPPTTTFLPEVQIPMAPQEVAPFSPPTLSQQMDFLGLQQVAENDQPQGFHYWDDQSLDDMLYDQGWKNQDTNQ